MHGTVVCQPYRFTAAKPPFPGPYGRWHQLLAHQGHWTPSLPQGSVLAPTLFNLYINDLPATSSRKFIYADDICCAVEGRTFAEIECTLSADLARMSEYCHYWRLKPSTTKTVTSVFHLHNPYPYPYIRLIIQLTHRNMITKIKQMI